MPTCVCFPVAWVRSIRARLAQRDVRKSIKTLEARIEECERHATWVESQLLELRCSVVLLAHECQAGTNHTGLALDRLRELVANENETKQRLKGTRRVVAALKRQRDTLVDSDLNSSVIHALRDTLAYLNSPHVGDVVDVEEVVEEVEDKRAETSEITAMLTQGESMQTLETFETIEHTPTLPTLPPVVSAPLEQDHPQGTTPITSEAALNQTIDAIAN